MKFLSFRDSWKLESFRHSLVYLESPRQEMVKSFKVSDAPCGLTVDVTVSAVDSPTSFYCQQLAAADKLASFGNALYEYCESSGELLAQPCAGQPCCAFFPDDESWYRGEILSVGPDGVKVLYVDYGNSAVVEADCLVELPEKFAQLPVQAWKCQLAGISPADGRTWSKEACDDFGAVLGDELSLEVVELRSADGTLPVNLYSYKTEMDIAEDLLIKKFAIEKADTGLRAAPGVEAGNELGVVITSTESPQCFYFQMLDTSKLNAMTTELNERYGALEANELSIKQPAVGSWCCVLYSEDDSWYRAEIVEVGASSVFAYFVDYGNTEEVSFAKTLLPEFGSDQLPAQAFQGGLGGFPNDTNWPEAVCTAFDHWATAASEQGVRIAVENVEDGFATVRFLDNQQAADVAKIVGGSAQSTSVALKECSIESNKWYDVMVSHVENANQLYCQLCAHGPDLQQVMSRLASSNPGSLREPHPGQPCVAPSSADGRLYRAQVEQVLSPTACRVRFVDFGNVEDMEMGKLRTMNGDIGRLPMQAIACSLQIPARLAEEKTAQVRALTDRKQFVAQFNIVEDVRAVRLMDTSGSSDVNIIQVLKSQHSAGSKPQPSASSQAPSLSAIKYPNFSVGSVHDMCCVSCSSPSDMWLSLSSRTEALDALMDQLAAKDGELKPLSRSGAVAGGACCARFSEDDGLYRAVITAPPSGREVGVCFVDYGNSENRGPSAVFELPAEFLSEPAFAFHCLLSGAAPTSGSWSQEAIDRINALVNSSLSVKILGGACGVGKQLEVAMLADGDNVATTLCREGLATSTQGDCSAPKAASSAPAPDTVSPPLPDIQTGRKYTVQVTDATSPGSFYVQFVDAQESLDTLMEALSSYEPTDSSVQWKSGMYCIAEFSGDGELYRAKVQATSGHMAHVVFVDFGNSEERQLEELLPMAKDFAQLPICAVHCSLADVFPVDGQKWSEKSCEAFSSFMYEQKVLAEFLSVNDGEWTVQISSPSGQLLSERLVREGIAKGSSKAQASTAQVVLKQGRLTGAVTVHVSHIESPECFYCQPSEQLSNLDNLAEALSSHCQSSPALSSSDVRGGVPCCAPFEGDWCRAVVTNASTSGAATVQFVDYGNSDTVALSDLRPLTEQLAKVPTLAVRCHLAQEAQWSDGACQAFSDQFYDVDASVKVVDQSSTSTAVSFTGESQALLQTFAPSSQQPASSPTSIGHLDWAQGTQTRLYVTHAVSPSEFWCQPVDQADVLETLGTEMSSHYDSSDMPGLTSVSVGQLCAVFSGVYEAWYRGEVIACVDNMATIHLVDYGSSENQEVENLCALEQRFASHCPALAVKCSLANAKAPSGGWTSKACAAFEERASAGELRAMIVSGDAASGVVLRLRDGQGEISAGVSSDQTQSPQQPAARPSSAPVKIPSLNVPKNPVSLYVVSATSPDEFWCQPVSSEARLSQLMEEMSTFYSAQASGSARVMLSAGTVCAAQYSEDEQWYRAVLENDAEGTLQARFVDYGNTEAVEEEFVRPLEEKFATKLPAQGIRCALDGVAAPSGGWTEDAIDFFYKLVVEQQFEVRTTGTRSDDTSVVEITGPTDIAKAMRDAGHVLASSVAGSSSSEQTPTTAAQLPSSPARRCFYRLL